MKIFKSKCYKVVVLLPALLLLAAACGRIEKEDNTYDHVPLPEVSASVTQSPPPAATPAPTPAQTPSPSPELGEPIEFADEWFGALMLSAVQNAEGNSNRDCVYEHDIEGITELWLKANFGFETYAQSFELIFKKGDTEHIGSITVEDRNYWDKEFIATLNDLKYFPKLEKLRLFGVWANDFSPVWQLSELENLLIYNCYNAGDLSGMKQLKNLRILYLGGWTLPESETEEEGTEGCGAALIANGISECETDISFLAEMPWLELLDLSGGIDIDLPVLSKISGLKALSISSNLDVLNLSELEGLNNIQYLWIRAGRYTGGSAVKNFPNLRYIELTQGMSGQAESPESVYVFNYPELYLD